MEFRREGDNLWVAEVALASWGPFRYRPRGSVGDGAREGGEPARVVVRPTPGPGGRRPLGAADLARVRWFLDNEAVVSDAARAAVVGAWPGLRDACDPSGEDTAAGAGALVSSAADLGPLVGLRSVVVHAVESDGAPYVGFELDCVLDDEHGLGVLMQGTRPVQVGGADTALLRWIAERDAARR